MNYTGKLRIATGLAFLHAFTETVDNAAHTKSRESLRPSCGILLLIENPHLIAIRILHGDADRTTSHKASMTYIDQVTSPDKSIKLYENHQHVMVKVCPLASYQAFLFADLEVWQVIGGKCEEADFERNQAVMDDWKTWLLERA
jgi:acylglycerol lipase